MFLSEVKSTYKEDISILVKLDNHPWNYLCECGEAKKLTVKDIQNCNAIFISHTHIDHFANFDAVIRNQIGIQRKVTICGPSGIAKQIQSRLQSYTWNLINEDAITYEIREYVSENKIIIYQTTPPSWDLKKVGEIDSNIIFKDAFFEVTGILLNHKIDTLAYKFKEYDTIKIDLESSGFNGGKWIQDLKDAFKNKEKKKIIIIDQAEYIAEDLFHLLHVKKGDSVGIIMDHAANDENHSKIKSHFYQCNKVFIESFYLERDKEFAITNFHSYSTMSAKIMNDSEVAHPIPVHFSRKYDQKEIQELTEEFFSVSSKQ